MLIGRLLAKIALHGRVQNRIFFERVSDTQTDGIILYILYNMHDVLLFLFI